LVRRGVEEPYRLFTSRAEFRLLLRQDNAIERLGPVATGLGLLGPAEQERLKERLEGRRRLRRWLQGTSFSPESVNPWLRDKGLSPVREKVLALDLLRRPEVGGEELLQLSGEGEAWSEEWVQSIEVEVKYEGYVRRESKRAERVAAQEGFLLPEELPYRDFVTLSWESREKLERLRPGNLAQAARISGVSPSDVQNLILEVRKWRRLARAADDSTVQE